MAQVNAGRVRFVGRGEYNNSTQYYTFDLVNYNGNSYFAKSNTLGNLPTNTTYWQLVAEKGNTGSVGPTGETGNGISSITKTSTSGLVDTYTITFTNGQTTTYQITNGANGSVVDVQVDGTSVVDNGIANIIGLTEMKQELEDMYNLLPKVQGTGETITLNNTVAGKMLVDLKGNTSQETTTGKNLNAYPYVDTTKTTNGITWTDNGDGTLTVNGTNSGTATAYFNMTNDKTNPITLPAGTYTASLGSASNVRATIARYDNMTTVIATIPINTSGKTFTLTEETQLTFILAINKELSVSNVLIKPMIEAGTTATAYEEYTGGVASPNPDYPQDIHVVSGNNTIKVEGKNLFDDSVVTNLWSNYNTQEIININGANLHKYDCKQGDTFTLSATFDSASGNGAILIQFFDENGNNLGRYAVSNNTTLTQTRTAPANTSYAYIGRYLTTPTTIQLEKGSNATTYEEYKGASYPINLGVENRFNTNVLNQGQYNNNASLQNNRITWYGKQIANGDTITVVCNNSNLRFNVGRTTMNTNNSGNVYSQESGWQTGTHTITYNGSDYACVIISKVDNTNVSTSEITNNDFTISYNGEYISSTPIELCKIGDYQDSIVKDNGKWYLNKQIGKVVLNGSESGWSYPSANRFNLDNIVNDYLKSLNNITYISDNYVAYKQTSANQGFNDLIASVDYGFNFGSGSGNNVRIKDTRYTDLTTFKTNLGTNNLLIYYVLATPTYTEITDSTLISQLETVKRSFNGQTNITQTNDDKPFILDVTALKELTE